MNCLLNLSAIEYGLVLALLLNLISWFRGGLEDFPKSFFICLQYLIGLDLWVTVVISLCQVSLACSQVR